MSRRNPLSRSRYLAKIGQRNDRRRKKRQSRKGGAARRALSRAFTEARPGIDQVDYYPPFERPVYAQGGQWQ